MGAIDDEVKLAHPADNGRTEGGPPGVRVMAPDGRLIVEIIGKQHLADDERAIDTDHIQIASERVQNAVADPPFFGIFPSTPWTYQFMPSRPPSLMTSPLFKFQRQRLLPRMPRHRPP